MATANQEPQAILFNARTPAELQKEVHDRYGEAVGRLLERGSAQKISVQDQQGVVKGLHDAGLNGQAEALLNAYKTHQRQFEVKSVVEDKWYHKVGRGGKEVALAPLKGVKWAFTKHPVISTLTVTALLAFLGYHYGIPMAQFAGEGGDERMSGVANTLRRLAQFAPGGEMPGAGEVPNLLPSYPEIVPPSIPLPDR